MLFDSHIESSQEHVPETVSSAEWSTPIALFAELDREFHFTVDVCASSGNAKCARFYTRSDDGLQQDWAPEVVWMNPPYGRGVIDQWMRKAYESSLGGGTAVCLVPSSTSTRWWHDYAMRGEIRFVRGRIKFGGSKFSALFPCSIIVFRPGRGEISA
jgi:phage N-6-adenine-methyltransferase